MAELDVIEAGQNHLFALVEILDAQGPCYEIQMLVCVHRLRSFHFQGTRLVVSFQYFLKLVRVKNTFSLAKNPVAGADYYRRAHAPGD